MADTRQDAIRDARQKAFADLADRRYAPQENPYVRTVRVSPLNMSRPVKRLARIWADTYTSAWLTGE